MGEADTPIAPGGQRVLPGGASIPRGARVTPLAAGELNAALAAQQSASDQMAAAKQRAAERDAAGGYRPVIPTDGAPGVPAGIVPPPPAPPTGPRQPGPLPPSSGGVARPTRAVDPLSVPYRLPSGGLLYQDIAPGWDGTVTLAPTRGEQEEILAGAGDKPEARMQILRHLVTQCVDLGPIELGDLVMDDWSSLLLHFLALSAGHDIIGLTPVHPKPLGCGRPSPQAMKLSDLPCVRFRPALPGETPTWPPAAAPRDPDPVMAVLKELEAEPATGEQVKLVGPDGLREPFVATVGPHTIGWRYLRVADLVAAEAFAAALGDARTEAGNPLHSYLLGRMLVSVDGVPMNAVSGTSWVRRADSPLLGRLREVVSRHQFGYEVAPRFRCRACGGSFKQRLPLDGGLFRGPAAGS